MAAPAANLQQNLSYWLKREPGAAASERPGWRPLLVTNRSHQFLHNRRLRHKRPRARVRKRHGPPLAADAVAKAAFAPPLPTIKPVTNWPKLGPVSEVDKARWAPGERHLAGLARQRLGLAREQRGSGKRRLVAGTPSPAARVARPAPFERPPPHPSGSFGEMSSVLVAYFAQQAAHDRRTGGNGPFRRLARGARHG